MPRILLTFLAAVPLQRVLSPIKALKHTGPPYLAPEIFTPNQQSRFGLDVFSH